MEQRGPGSYAAREEDLAMVEFCDLLPRLVVWKLDLRLDDGWYRIELVAKYSCDICQSTHLVRRHVFQFKVRQCLSYWISRSRAQRVWYVGELLLRRG